MARKEKTETEKAITWAQIHNTFPLLVTLVSVVLAWGNFSSQIAVMRRDLDDVHVRLERMEQRLNKEVMGAAITPSPTPTPTETPTPTPRVTRGASPTKP